jgi:hypothetical protein
VEQQCCLPFASIDLAPGANPSAKLYCFYAYMWTASSQAARPIPSLACKRVQTMKLPCYSTLHCVAYAMFLTRAVNETILGSRLDLGFAGLCIIIYTCIYKFRSFAEGRT